MNVEYLREGQLVPLTSLSGGRPIEELLAEVGRKNAVLKAALRLRSAPISIQLEAGPKVCVSGVAGSLTLFGRAIEILPKFAGAQVWHDNIAVLLGRAHGGRFAFEETRGGTRRHQSFIDHVAYAYARALRVGLADGPIETYRDTPNEGFVARGQINLRETLARTVRRPGLIVSVANELHSENTYNHLLHAAAQSLIAMVRDPSVRGALRSVEEELPMLASAPLPPRRLPDRLPPQFNSYAEAIEIASAVIQGRDWGMGTATSTAFGYVVAMETLFEKFVEATVLRATGLLPPNINASARSQVSTIFAQPQNGGRRPYYTRPDNVVSLDAKPAIIIDAKYKRFADAETGGSGRPSNADIYQMFAAMAAQECRLAVLVYPSIRDLEGPIPIWKTRIGGEEAFVAATAIQISDLRTAEDVRSVDKRLAAALQLLLYKAYGPTIHVAA